jgi:hypothetical protein
MSATHLNVSLLSLMSSRKSSPKSTSKTLKTGNSTLPHMNPIHKAVIPVAGLGTRHFPASHARFGIGTGRWSDTRPHPGPLPQEREQPARVIVLREFTEPAPALGSSKMRRTILPLPGGEGWGEGERFNPLQNIQQPTSNIEQPVNQTSVGFPHWMLGVGCSMLVVSHSSISP